MILLILLMILLVIFSVYLLFYIELVLIQCFRFLLYGVIVYLFMIFGFLFSVAIFDRSGRYVITGSDDRLVKIWSMETAFCLASCRGHEVSLDYFSLFIRLTFLCFFPFSCFFKKYFYLMCLKGDITDLAVSSNNALVASSSNDFIIRVVS